jgi:capsular polysaccharide biosynthesis protein
MTQPQKSDQNGELKDETTGLPQALPFISVESQSTSVTLDITVEAKNPTDSQLIPNSSQENPNSVHARMVMAFVAKLGELVETKKGYAQGWQVRVGDILSRHFLGS